MKRLDENHSFNINVATILGSIQKAILLKEIYGWILINKSKNNNLRLGYYWTFMSSAAFAEKFTYMPKGSISRWLKELQQDKWIYSCKKFNRRGFDRTKWYTLDYSRYDLAVKSELSSISQNDKWFSQIEKCISHFEESISQNEKTIPSPSHTLNTSTTNLSVSENSSTEEPTDKNTLKYLAMCDRFSKNKQDAEGQKSCAKKGSDLDELMSLEVPFGDNDEISDRGKKLKVAKNAIDKLSILAHKVFDKPIPIDKHQQWLQDLYKKYNFEHLPKFKTQPTSDNIAKLWAELGQGSTEELLCIVESYCKKKPSYAKNRKVLYRVLLKFKDSVDTKEIKAVKSIVDEAYSSLFSEPYSWKASHRKHIQSIWDQVKASRKNKGLGINDSDIENAISILFNSLPDKYKHPDQFKIEFINSNLQSIRLSIASGKTRKPKGSKSGDISDSFKDEDDVLDSF